MIFHQNIAGLVSKRELIELTLDELVENGMRHDVLCFTETFAKKGNEGNLRISGYRLAATYSRLHQKRGGVCIFCRTDIQTRTLPFMDEFSEDYTFECCGIEIMSLKCIVICIYRTPTASPSVFLRRMDLLMTKLKYKLKFKIVIAGDFNIDMLKTTNNSRELTRMATNNNFNFHILCPTRRESCLDQILSNVPQAQGKTLSLGLSDHETAQSLAIPVTSTGEQRAYFFRFRRDYSPENCVKFYNYLNSLSWSDVYDKNNAPAAFKHFHDMFALLYKLCFPVIKIRINIGPHYKAWFTRGIKKSITTKRRLRFSYYKKSKNHTNYMSSKIKFKKYSRLLRSCINNAQKITNIKYLASSKNICKTTWSVIKNVAKNNVIEGNIEKIVNNGEVIHNPVDIANTFNNYYINMTKSNINNKPKADLLMINRNIHNMFLTPTDACEVSKIIKALNPTNSAGYDDIQTKIIKGCSQTIAAVVSYIVNLSFAGGVYPEPLKLSLVRPLHKKGNKECVQNYRPISIIPVISKVFEKAFHVRIASFLNKYEIIKPQQFGFQKGKSTTLAAFTLLNKILGFMNVSMPVSAIFFDMSRAFDFVCHETLLAKCERYGIRGVVNDWLRDYLKSRSQFVEVTNTNTNNTVTVYRSSIQVNGVGVPQGSILGPLLFILYINDLPNVIDFDCTLFADDLSVVIPCRDATTYNNDINNTITNVVN